MKNKNWILSAIVLGIIFFIAIWVKKPIGVSTQFSVMSGIIHSSIDPNVITEDKDRSTGYKSTNEYYDKSDGKLASSIKNPINYDFIFVLSIPIGSYLAYLFNKKKNIMNNYEIIETPKLPDDSERGLWKLYFPPFIGGFLILYGARMADGCTSGHMMSGIMQGSLSGYIFGFSVFVIAIPTAIIIHKNRI